MRFATHSKIFCLSGVLVVALAAYNCGGEENEADDQDRAAQTSDGSGDSGIYITYSVKGGSTHLKCQINDVSQGIVSGSDTSLKMVRTSSLKVSTSVTNSHVVPDKEECMANMTNRRRTELQSWLGQDVDDEEACSPKTIQVIDDSCSKSDGAKVVKAACILTAVSSSKMFSSIIPRYRWSADFVEMDCPSGQRCSQGKCISDQRPDCRECNGILLNICDSEACTRIGSHCKFTPHGAIGGSCTLRVGS